jgi:hypothetical protein
MSNGGIETTNGSNPVGNNERIAGTDNDSEKNGFHTRTVKRALVAIAGIAAFSVACKGSDTAIQNNAEDKKNDAENNPQASQVYPADNQETQETEEYADGVPVGIFTTTPTPTVTLSPTPTPTETVEPTPTSTKIPMSEDSEVRNYRITKDGSDSKFNGFTFWGAKLQDWRIEDNKVVINVKFSLYGKEFEEEMTTPYDAFRIHIYNSNYALLEEKVLFSGDNEEEISEYFNSFMEDDKAIAIEASVFNYNTINDKLMLNFVNDEVDFELGFTDIMSVQGN